MVHWLFHTAFPKMLPIVPLLQSNNLYFRDEFLTLHSHLFKWSA